MTAAGTLQRGSLPEALQSLSETLREQRRGLYIEGASRRASHAVQVAIQRSGAALSCERHSLGCWLLPEQEPERWRVYRLGETEESSPLDYEETAEALALEWLALEDIREEQRRAERLGCSLWYSWAVWAGEEQRRLEPDMLGQWESESRLWSRWLREEEEPGEDRACLPIPESLPPLPLDSELWTYQPEGEEQEALAAALREGAISVRDYCSQVAELMRD